MANNCTLLVNNQIYGGWKTIRIDRGIEQMSGGFSLEVTEKWPDQVTERPIFKGDVCVVKIGDEVVCTGYVNRTNSGYDAFNTWFSVEGRDKTCDLIDCAAIHKSGQWKSSNVSKIAADLCQPFTIAVVVGDRASKKAAETIASFSLEDGETVQDALSRLLRMKALMMWTDGKGNLVIDLPDQTPSQTALVEGENILSAESNQDETEQFSEYVVKGQGRGKHDSKATATDAEVKRYRPMLILAEDQSQTPQERAKYEATIRSGKADRASIRVQSWVQAGDDGPLWTPGLRVQVKSPRLQKDSAEMIIAAVTYTKSEQEGTVCELKLAHPDAFDQLAENPQKPKPPAKKKPNKATKKPIRKPT